MFWFLFSGPSRCSGKGLGLSVFSWDFPLQKFADIPRCLMLFPHYRFIIPTSRFNRFRQFRGIVWLAKHMRIRKSLHLGSWILGRQMLGSDYNLVPRAFPLENGRSAKALWTRIKLTAKTPGTKILLVVSAGSLEKRSNQPKYKESKTRSPRTTAKLIQNNVYCFFITIFRLAIPAFFMHQTDVTELM